MHTTLVVSHIAGALVALLTGSLAFIYPNGTRTHRLLGKLYLAGWVVLAIPGYILGADDGRISIFEVAQTFGVFSTAYAYALVLRRKRIGRTWLPRHYNWMMSSMAGLIIATANQVLPRIGLEYPIWVFVLLCCTPTFIIPFFQRRLDRRYGFAKQPKSQQQAAT